MTASEERPRWLKQWIAACRENLRDPVILDLVSEWRRGLLVESDYDVQPRRVLAEAAALLVRMGLPYRFTGKDPILSFAGARRRGFGACGDGSAAVAAACLLAAPAASVTLCYEQPLGAQSSYAHVAVDVAGVRADPYPDASRPAARCDRADDVRELLGWHVQVAPRDESRR